jgi:hypothetical protein
MCQSRELKRLTCRTPWRLLSMYDRPLRCTPNMPFEGQIQHARLKQGLVWAISVGGKGRGLMRSVFGNSKDDWTGVVEVQRAEALAAAVGMTGEKADKVLMVEVLVSLVYCRTDPQLLQTADHPERDQLRRMVEEVVMRRGATKLIRPQAGSLVQTKWSEAGGN